jgi:hypothetical protein
MNSGRRISKGKIGGLVVLLAGVMGVILWNRQPVRPVVPAPPQPTQSVAPVAETPLRQVEEPVKESSVQPAPKPKAPVQAQAPAAKPPKEPLHDPDARDALALVGLDPDAEQYWLSAIYDSNLPDNEREDLMEDLNETGFADPKNLTADDLPLIISRLEIIDAVLPNTDDFMAEHLLEAQKDLINMFGKVSQH